MCCCWGWAAPALSGSPAHDLRKDSADSPTLHVLDSTDPAQVKAFEHQIDIPKTLYIVSSKSGSTLEPNIFKQYFFERTKQAVGATKAGSQFIAITDPGSKMQQVAGVRSFPAYLLRTSFHRRALFGSLELRHGSSRRDGGWIPRSFYRERRRWYARAGQVRRWRESGSCSGNHSRSRRKCGPRQSHDYHISWNFGSGGVAGATARGIDRESRQGN